MAIFTGTLLESFSAFSPTGWKGNLFWAFKTTTALECPSTRQISAKRIDGEIPIAMHNSDFFAKVILLFPKALTQNQLQLEKCKTLSSQKHLNSVTAVMKFPWTRYKHIHEHTWTHSRLNSCVLRLLSERERERILPWRQRSFAFKKKGEKQAKNPKKWIFSKKFYLKTTHLFN
jgi:hypothetical protein